MTQTACPHCGSTNRLETAGQTYCADCGQLLTAQEKKVEKKPPEKKAVEKKKEPVKAVAQKAPARPKKTAPPLNLKAIEQARSPKAVASKNPATVDTRQTHAKTIAKPAPRRRPVVAAPVVKPAPIEAAMAEVRTPAAKDNKFRHKLALRDAFKSLRTRKTYQIAVVATLITTICEAAFVSMYAKTGLYAITETIAAGSINAARATTLIGHAAWAGLLGFVGYLVYHYARAEIIFRTSRIFDRRSVSDAPARRAALGSLAGMFIIDVITWILAALSVALVVGANFGFLGTKSLGVMGIVLAVATNLIAVYVWFGLIAARHMATYAIVLGQVGVFRAYSTGWALFNRQFGRITAGLILIGVINAVIALPASLLGKALGVESTMALLIGTIAVAITQAIIMVVGAVYFLRLYRYVIAREYDSELGHLLSGRQAQASKVKPRLIALGVITVVWVGIMTALILNSSPLASAIIR